MPAVAPPSPRPTAALLLVAALLAAGCVAPRGAPTVRPAPGAHSSGELDALSPAARQTLRLLHLEATFRERPAEALAVLAGHRLASGNEALFADEAEVARLAADRLRGFSAERAAEWYLLAAGRAWQYLFERGRGPMERAFDARFIAMRDLYSASVGDFLELRRATGRLDEPASRSALSELAVRRIDGGGRYDASRWDEILAADGLSVRNLRNRYRREGLGTPLVLRRANDGEGAVRNRPAEGIIEPATALVRFELEPEAGPLRGRATIELLDPRREPDVRVGRHRVPLAADFTAPYAYLASLGDLARSAVRGVVHPAEVTPIRGVYLLEAYDAGRVPVLMVHGLRSSPLAWLELTNDLLGDPRLRARYQVWHYVYPSGLPYLFAGHLLAEDVEALLARLRADAADPGEPGLVVIAHSMGGLLVRTLVAESGDRLWRAGFLSPYEEIVGREEDRLWLHRLFHFSPRPWVDRVVFIAVPHRGTEAADGVLARLSSRLVDLPEAFLEPFDRLLAANRERVRPDLLAYFDRKPTSIRALSPEHPILRALARTPFAPGVPLHTILGDRGRGTAEPVSDGWVTYDSAHLEEAVSERIVPAGHDAHSHPAATDEVKRILHRHLEELAAGGASPPR